MRHVFIADAHLRHPNDENYRRLLAFLETLSGTTDTLFILGDLFEFWIGYRKLAFPHFLPVLGQLRQLRENGVKIVYCEGNHDFHMGPYFKETLDARISSGVMEVELDGRRVHLCHGDQINRADYGYRMLRALLHSPLTKLLTYVVPPSVASALAEWMGGQSRKKHARRRTRWDYHSILRRYAESLFASGCDVVVTGHFHQPLVEPWECDSRRIIVSLGDWITHFSYGEWVDGEITLKSFP
ncbi:UDP-2,3-diacylglucosamine diphosphatase [Geobacter sp. DSM 9736]|uniref:UDP-2,3-diacylglucosamine diphosphatase n=1 Tax=Geobacter sp. DSM 9736 TaxID=1277350 RepID=UPI000B503053|nr:UDP-2,3-diacylglucosamine diphosphatase [Geobacter sp. DSM 9736]SNB48033.1 UDP-2,3-diacylglucosamine hydrolase [Geobacter sp. DSM 9736]